MSSFVALARSFLRNLFRRRQVEAELQAELDSYLELVADQERVAGRAPAASRRAARLRLGSPERVKEEVRDVRAGALLEETVSDLRQGLRRLRRNPGFTIAAALSLALGIGANAAIFSVVNDVLLSPLPYPDPERLVLMFSAAPSRGVTEAAVSPEDLADWQSSNRSFDAIGAFPAVSITGLVLAGDGEPVEVNTSYVTEGFFEALAVRPLHGRALGPADHTDGNNRRVVLSHRFWHGRLGGDDGLIGGSLRLDGVPYEVLGVMPAGFRFPEAGIDLWAPRTLIPPAGIPRDREVRWMIAVGRLAAGVTIEQATEDMKRVTGDLAVAYPESNEEVTAATIRPLQDVVVTEARPTLLVLLAAVGLVLMIACANVASMSLARAEKRRREVAISSALGAGRLRLVRQLLAESLLLASLGGAIGLVLATGGVQLLAELAPWEVMETTDVAIDGRVLAFTTVLSILTGLVFGLAPALKSTDGNVAEVLGEGDRSQGAAAAQRPYQRAFVTVQVALVTVVTIAAGLNIGSYRRLLDVDPGFDPSGVLTLRVACPEYKYPESDQIKAFYRQVLERVGGLPQVAAAGIVKPLPLAPDTSLGERWGYVVEGRQDRDDDAATPRANVRFIGPGYFEALGIPVLAGRDYRAVELDGVIVDQALAENAFPGASAIGQRIRLTGDWKTIVGVVGNVKQVGLAAADLPTVYTHYQQYSRRGISLVVRSDAPAGAIFQAVQQQVWEIDPQQPVSLIASMEDLVLDSAARPRFLMVLLSLFAGLAVALAAVGIYGTLSYAVSRRTHEIGVRISVGAEVTDILRLVMRQAMSPVLLGIVVGLVLAGALKRALESLLFEMSAAEPAVFIIVPLVLTLVATLASYLPARRAAHIDPVEALRYQ